jgi:amidase
VTGGLESVTDVRFAVGPMASPGDVTALRLLVKAVLADEPWLRDPLVAEMPWREDVYLEAKPTKQQGKQLVVGVAPTDGLVTPQPPVLRAVETVAAALRDQGHVVIPFSSSSSSHSQSHGDTTAQEANYLWAAAAYADLTFAHAQFRASGEVVDPLMPPAFDPDKLGSTENSPLGTAEVQRLNVRIRKYREAYLRQWMETGKHKDNPTGRPVDVVITPVAPCSAARIGKIRYFGE